MNGRACAVIIACALSAHAMAQTPARTKLSDGVFTSAQAERGKIAYDTNCAECHMPDLSGREYAGPLAGDGFKLKWRDAPLADLLGRMRSMPYGRPGLLTRGQYVDILAYALSKNGYPAGATELTAPLVAQWPQIRIERTP